MSRMSLIPAIRNYSAFIVDLDGVVYLRRTLIPGADRFMDALESEGKRFVFLTNNSSKTREEYVDALSSMGIETDSEHVVTSAFATCQYLVEHCPGSRVYAVGGRGLFEELDRCGLETVNAPPADYVVVGMDVSFTYEKLKAAAGLIRSGAKFISTNRDATYPTEDGLLPGAGSIVAAIQTASGRRPTNIGKPNRRIRDFCSTLLGVSPGMTAIVGDRFETDIVGGFRAGMGTVLVLSGVTTEADAEKLDPRPDVVVPSVAELLCP